MISADEALSEIGISVPQVRRHESAEGFWETAGRVTESVLVSHDEINSFREADLSIVKCSYSTGNFFIIY